MCSGWKKPGRVLGMLPALGFHIKAFHGKKLSKNYLDFWSFLGAWCEVVFSGWFAFSIYDFRMISFFLLQFRIPAVVQTDDGIILAFAEVIKRYFGFHLHQFYNLNTGSPHQVFPNQCSKLFRQGLTHVLIVLSLVSLWDGEQIFSKLKTGMAESYQNISKWYRRSIVMGVLKYNSDVIS